MADANDPPEIPMVEQLEEKLAAEVPPKIKERVKPVTIKVTRITRHPINKMAPHAEHIGFVAYAAVETFHLGGVIYLVCVWLFITGVWVMVTHCKTDDGDKA